MCFVVKFICQNWARRVTYMLGVIFQLDKLFDSNGCSDDRCLVDDLVD